MEIPVAKILHDHALWKLFGSSRQTGRVVEQEIDARRVHTDQI